MWVLVVFLLGVQSFAGEVIDFPAKKNQCSLILGGKSGTDRVYKNNVIDFKEEKLKRVSTPPVTQIIRRAMLRETKAFAKVMEFIEFKNSRGPLNIDYMLLTKTVDPFNNIYHLIESWKSKGDREERVKKEFTKIINETTRVSSFSVRGKQSFFEEILKVLEKNYPESQELFDLNYYVFEDLGL